MKKKLLAIILPIILVMATVLSLVLMPSAEVLTQDAFANAVKTTDKDAVWAITNYTLDKTSKIATVEISVQMKENKAAAQPDCFTFYMISNQDVSLSGSGKLVAANTTDKTIGTTNLATINPMTEWSSGTQITASQYYWQKGAPSDLNTGYAKRIGIATYGISNLGYNRWVLTLTLTGVESGFDATFGIQEINNQLPGTFAWVYAGNTTTGYTFNETNRWLRLPKDVSVNYTMRSGDTGTLAFNTTSVTPGSALTAAKVPGVTFPTLTEGAWVLDGYYVNGVKNTAAQLAAKVIDEETNVEVRTFPDGTNGPADGVDDRLQIKLTYTLRTGDQGTLAFAEKLVLKNTAITSAAVPAVTLPTNWVLDGYYIGSTKNTAAQMATKTFAVDTAIEVRTFPDGTNDVPKDGNDHRLQAVVTYVLRDTKTPKDQGTFTPAKVAVLKNSQLGSANVAKVTLPAKWKFEKFIAGGRDFPADLLQYYTVTGDTTIIICTFPDVNDNNIDDRDEVLDLTLKDNDKPVAEYEVPVNATLTVLTEEDGPKMPGVSPNPITITEDTEYDLPEPPVKEGLEFANWDSKQDDDGNVTVWPVYQPIGAMLKDPYKNELILKLDYIDAFITPATNTEKYNSTTNVLTYNSDSYDLNDLIKAEYAGKITWTVIEEARGLKNLKDISLNGTKVRMLNSSAFKVMGTYGKQTVTIYVLAPADVYADAQITSYDSANIAFHVATVTKIIGQINLEMADVDNDGYITDFDKRCVIKYNTEQP